MPSIFYKDTKCMEYTHTQLLYEHEHRLFEANEGAGSPDWIKKFRAEAMASFAGQGFPNTNKEEWRFTNCDPIAKHNFTYCPDTEFPMLASEALSGYAVDTNEYRFVFVNGHFAGRLSCASALIPGVTAINLASPATVHSDIIRTMLAHGEGVQTNAFAALNMAFLYDGLFIHIAKNTVIDVPIHILHIAVHAPNSSTQAAYPHVLIAAEDGAAATIVESFYAVDEQTSFTNAVTKMTLGAKSSIEYVKVQHENTNSFHIHTVAAVQRQESRLAMFSLSLGGAIARSELHVELGGENANCIVNGLYMANGTQLSDHHTSIRHTEPDCTSRELFKGILDGAARAVYAGNVFVDTKAQQTDSQQTNRNLMLSETASVYTQPQLEIFADDVKCTHGATVGGVSEQNVFYLKSRGIGPITARGIVCVGFAAEATSAIAHAAARTMVDRLVVAQLRKTLGSEIPEIVHSGNTNEKV